MQFRFLDEIPIDIPHTLHQLLGRFQSVPDGVAELIKNAKDQYSALGITDPDERIIIVAADTKKMSIGVFDLAGATSDDFRRWQVWSDPNANRAHLATDIEGGHGNGGKAFMVRGSTAASIFESCRGGRRTCMGFLNQQKANVYRPAFVMEGGHALDDVAIGDVSSHLASRLRELRVDTRKLPAALANQLQNAANFSLVRVDGIRDWQGRRADALRRLKAQLPTDIATHPQAALSLESCKIWVILDGVVNAGRPVGVQPPEPMPGFEALPPISVPDQLVDDRTGESVVTGGGSLQLRTSLKTLRVEATKPLNVIRVRNDRNIVANWPVAGLHPQAESAFIFGELRVEALSGDHLLGADRMSLADTALVRVLQTWTGEQIHALAMRIQKETAADHSKEDVDAANRGLKRLREMMQRYLSLDSRGSEGTGAGDKGEGESGSDVDETPERELGTRVDELVLEGGARSIAMAVGTTVPIRLVGYEVREDGTRLRVPTLDVEAVIEPPEHLDASIEKLMVTARREGVSTLRFRERSTAVHSNAIEIEGVVTTGMTVTGVPERVLLQGEHVSLKLAFDTGAGSRDDLLVQGAIDETNMGRISRYGVFTAGGRSGDATVRLRFGPGPSDQTSIRLTVGDERVPRKGPGGTEGGDVPLILLCGTEVPGMENFPPEQRTIAGGEQFPTIIDYEPEFDNVIFLNPNSKESQQVRKGRGGRRGTMSIGTPTFLQFMALKCFEILKRLKVRQTIKDQAINDLQFRQQFALAETDCAPFIDAAYEAAQSLAEN